VENARGTGDLASVDHRVAYSIFGDLEWVTWRGAARGGRVCDRDQLSVDHQALGVACLPTPDSE
jgi:hypothetical protein